MNYYHLYVEYMFGEGKAQTMQEAYVKDVTDLTAIKNDYIKPFVSGAPFIIVSGRIVKTNFINIFRVMESSSLLSEIVQKKNASVPRNVILIYTAADLLKNGCEDLSDITLKLINDKI